jgi:O-antigen ligase
LFATIFVLSGLISALIDPDVMSGLGIFKAYFVDGLLVYLLVTNLSAKQKGSFSDVLVLSGVVAAIGALLLYANDIRSSDNRIIDLSLLSSNYLAMYLAPIFILAVAKLRRKVGIRNFFLSLAILILLLTMYLTNSRGVIVAVIPAMIYLLYSLVKNKTRLVKTGFVVLALAFFAGGYLYYQPDWSDHDRKATSSNIRYYIWTTSIEMIRLNPVWGVGLSNYQSYFTDLTKDRVNYPEFIAPQALTAHNIFLQLYLATGLPGLLAFIALIALALFRTKNKQAVAFMITIIAYGLVDTPFFRNDLAILVWIALALCYEDRN